MQLPIVLNMFGGPGSGKSVVACGAFSLLKMHGVNTEIVTEFAKDLVWEGMVDALSNQYYVFGQQHHRMYRIKDKVDVIITDSPLLLNIVYGKLRNIDISESFFNTVKDSHERFNNMNFFLSRGDNYTEIGRIEKIKQSKEIDTDILENVLSDYTYYRIQDNESGINTVVEKTLSELKIKAKVHMSRTCL